MAGTVVDPTLRFLPWQVWLWAGYDRLYSFKNSLGTQARPSRASHDSERA